MRLEAKCNGIITISYPLRYGHGIAYHYGMSKTQANPNQTRNEIERTFADLNGYFDRLNSIKVQRARVRLARLLADGWSYDDPHVQRQVRRISA